MRRSDLNNLAGGLCAASAVILLLWGTGEGAPRACAAFWWTKAAAVALGALAAHLHAASGRGAKK